MDDMRRYYLLIRPLSSPVKGRFFVSILSKLGLDKWLRPGVQFWALSGLIFGCLVSACQGLSKQ
ncbi:MAG: hypothetical protein KUG71_02015 [Porticoccaceae bacterium]|nr:hypothetical protein [Porticoccaceae bacterium]